MESTQFIPSVFGISAHSIVALQKPPHCNQSHSAAENTIALKDAGGIELGIRNEELGIVQNCHSERSTECGVEE